MEAGTIDDFCFTHQFKLSYGETENVAIGHKVASEDISAGGHLWRFHCYPRGDRKKDKGEYVSIFLHHISESKDVKAMLEAFVMDRDGVLPSSRRKNGVYVYSPNGSWGWSKFVKRSVLELLYVTNGWFIIMCRARVLPALEVPPSDIGSHLGLLLDSADGADVSFVVGGEEFPAHRVVLAARSPVFKAQLLGSMAEAKMPSITLHDIAPATFRVMLRFMYTDACPADAELGDSRSEMLQHLLAAADRFALDRLKLLCASKLWEKVSVETVADTLSCAETYSCQELKKKCINFLAEDKNFKKAVLTKGFGHLLLNFPLIIDELREKTGA